MDKPITATEIKYMIISSPKKIRIFQWLKSLITLGGGIFGFYINHHYLGDGVILQLILAGLLLIFMYTYIFVKSSNSFKEFQSEDEAIEYLKSI